MLPADLPLPNTHRFLGYNQFTYDSTGLELNLMDVNIGWDRFSISVNGVSHMTTRFLDDISSVG